MPDRLALFTGGIFAKSNAKTAHGILRYGTREVVCVVDDVSAGAVASSVVPLRASRGARRGEHR